MKAAIKLINAYITVISTAVANQYLTVRMLLSALSNKNSKEAKQTVKCHYDVITSHKQDPSLTQLG